MTTPTKHAVITENYIAWRDEGNTSLMWHMCPITSAAHAHEVAQVCGFTHMWVLPGGWCDRAGKQFWHVEPPYDVFFAGEELPTFGRVNTGRKTPTLLIGYPRAFGWQAETAGDLLDTILYLEGELGVPVQWGGAHMGRAILKELWAKKPRIIRDCTIDTRDLPYNGIPYEVAYDLLFRRELTPDMIGQWVHHYDKNSSYLAASRGLYMGVGDPTHVEHEEGVPIVPGLPGIYRVTWESPYPEDSAVWPSVIDPRQEWVTNEVLKYAIKQYGADAFFIHEAYVWEDSARVLDELAWKVWSTRKMFKHIDQALWPNENARLNAYKTCKGIALATVGSFHMNRADHPGINMIHSHWWAEVVGKARVNILANIAKYAPVAGVPVCIEADGLYYVSRDENWRSAVPGILDRCDELGGYKHSGSCKITKWMVEQAQGMSVGQLAEMFKVAGGEKE